MPLGHGVQVCFKSAIEINHPGPAVLGEAVSPDRELLFLEVYIRPAQSKRLRDPGTTGCHESQHISKHLGRLRKFKGGGAKFFHRFSLQQVSLALVRLQRP